MKHHNIRKRVIAVNVLKVQCQSKQPRKQQNTSPKPPILPDFLQNTAPFSPV